MATSTSSERVSRELLPTGADIIFLHAPLVAGASGDACAVFRSGFRNWEVYCGDVLVNSKFAPLDGPGTTVRQTGRLIADKVHDDDRTTSASRLRLWLTETRLPCGI